MTDATDAHGQAGQKRRPGQHGRPDDADGALDAQTLLMTPPLPAPDGSPGPNVILPPDTDEHSVRFGSRSADFSTPSPPPPRPLPHNCGTTPETL
ncbi:hypothetical protein GCM10009579_50990 [Streptomyces javensis]|uniref:Uncharacterized protein n=1 Tax=Streptomyces javensis TaxID=114698 RepID=A0ABN1X660_9ACTN